MEYFDEIKNRRSYLCPFLLGLAIIIESRILTGSLILNPIDPIGVINWIGLFLIILGLYDLIRVDKRNKIHEIFDDLRETGLVDKKRELKSSFLVQNFKSGILFFNTIFYSRKYEKEYSELNEDEIRFILLHEEGHKKVAQSSIIALIYTFGIGITSYLLISIGLTYSGLPKITIVLVSYGLFFIWLFIFTVFIRIFQKPLEFDEFDSDFYAANALKNNFNINKPSKIVANVMESLTRIHKTEIDNDGLLKRIIIIFYGYHPPIDERIEKIEKNVDFKG